MTQDWMAGLTGPLFLVLKPWEGVGRKPAA